MANFTTGYPSQGMPCPKCHGNQAYTIKDDSYAKKVKCPECGYTLWLKHYRAELKLALQSKDISQTNKSSKLNLCQQELTK